MYRTDIGLSLSGYLSYCKFTIGIADLPYAATSQTIALPWNTLASNPINFAIPQGGVMLGVRVHATTAFAGPSVTAMTVSVGVNGGSNTFFTNAFDIFQAVSNTTLQETSMFKSGLQANPGGTANVNQQVSVTFTATGANLALLTAGSVDIYFCFLNVSTPLI
jgi:hypothetical protein